MRTLRRHGVNKRKSARRFRKSMSQTKAANMGGLARGGWRL